MDEQAWAALPDRLSTDPDTAAELHEFVAALRRAVAAELTDYQRQVFVAVALHDVPIDELALQLGSNRKCALQGLV